MKHHTKPMTITIDDPDHVRLRRGATIRIGNNDELAKNNLGSMSGVWQVVHVYPAQEGKQRYDVEPMGINRHQLRARLKRLSKGNFQKKEM